MTSSSPFYNQVTNTAMSKLPSIDLLDSNQEQKSFMHYTTAPYYYYPFMQNYYHVSPPLTPVVSPLTSMLTDSSSEMNDDRTENFNDRKYDPYLAFSPSSISNNNNNNHSGSRDSSVTSISPPYSVQHKHICHHRDCGWSFKRYEHLKRHMLVHTGDRPYHCQYPGCCKSFSRSDNYHAHYRTHTKKKLSQKRGTKHGVTRDRNCHQESGFPLLAHPAQSQQITPSIASTVAANAAAVVAQQFQQNGVSHVYYNTTMPTTNQQDVKSHVCPVVQCHSRFKRLEHLKRHMRIHTLERPFKCTKVGCQKSFSRSDNLSQHIKTHLKASR